MTRVAWRFILGRWRAAATIGSMKTEQTVMVVTIRDDGTRRRRHLVGRLRSLLRHPVYQGAVTFTEETFPQAPPVPLEEDER